MTAWLRRLFCRPPGPFDAAAMAAAFLDAASRGGTPRGLRWVSAEPTGEPLHATKGGEAFVLLAVVVRFEPVPGSDMEDVPAARNPRPATAVFRWAGSTWAASGRAVFNLSPGEVAAQGGYRLTAPEASG